MNGSEVSLRQTTGGPNFEGLTDEALALAIAERNESALHELIRRYGGQVRRVCKRICFDETEVSAVISDVFWQLWRNAESYDASRGTVRTYLLTMARSRAIDKRRAAVSRQKLHSHLATLAGGFSAFQDDSEISEGIVSEERAHEVRKALCSLPDLQQIPIELAFFDGLTHEEVARHLDAPLGTVKSRIRSGLIHLKKILGGRQHAEELS